MYLKENNIKYHLKAGDFFLLEPDLFHEGYCPAICDYYYVHFKSKELNISIQSENESLKELIEKRRTSIMSYNLDEADVIDPYTYIPKLFRLSDLEYRQRFHGIINIYDKREEHYKRVVSTEFHSFLLAVSHEYLMTNIAIQNKDCVKKAELIAEQLLEYINQNYTKKLKSADIEEMFEISFDYINRVFLKITGNTVFRYINLLRISKAKQLIATTNMPFGEIAYLVGIDDRYYFSKLFHKYTQMTPTEYYQRNNDRKYI